MLLFGQLSFGRVGVEGGISEQTFCRWKRRYVELEIGPVHQLKRLQEENQR